MNHTKPIVSSQNENCDWAETQRRHAAAIETIRPLNKSALFDILARSGITAVVVGFDGYSDNGQIEEVEAKAGDTAIDLPSGAIEIARVSWGSPEIERLTLPVEKAIEQLAYDFLGEIRDGWEDNDGAYGDFTFDVTARTIALNFYKRVSDAVHSRHEF